MQVYDILSENLLGLDAELKKITDFIDLNLSKSQNDVECGRGLCIASAPGNGKSTLLKLLRSILKESCTIFDCNIFGDDDRHTID